MEEWAQRAKQEPMCRRSAEATESWWGVSAVSWWSAGACYPLPPSLPNQGTAPRARAVTLLFVSDQATGGEESARGVHQIATATTAQGWDNPQLGKPTWSGGQARELSV